MYHIIDVMAWTVDDNSNMLQALERILATITSMYKWNSEYTL